MTQGADAFYKGPVPTIKKKTTKSPGHRKTAAKKAPKRRAAKTPAKRIAARTVKPVRAAQRAPKRPVAAAVPSRPARRAVFIDVENTSSEAALFQAIADLRIDRHAQPVELTAVGNWRAVGPLVARKLGAMGAQLVHSAPARGVRDWSDLWIAVAAGCWLGQALPGDVLEIISNDRAFDAVGDTAAARGVGFRRIQHQRGERGTASLANLEEGETDEAKPKRPRRTRGGRRRGRRRGPAATPTRTQSPAVPPAPARPSQTAPPIEEPHGASRDQIVAAIRGLTKEEVGRWVNIDILEKSLKAQGFARPPGSARLVTRLRQLKDVEVDANGRVRIALSASSSALPEGESSGAAQA